MDATCSLDVTFRQPSAPPSLSMWDRPAACPSLPADLVAHVLVWHGLRELHVCAQLSSLWRAEANARRDALRLVQHETSFGVRGSGKDQIHNASSLALADRKGSLFVCEKERMRLLGPSGDHLSLWGHPGREHWQGWLPSIVPNVRGSSGPSGLAVRPNPRGLEFDPAATVPNCSDYKYLGDDQILYVSDAGTDRVYKITRKVFTMSMSGVFTIAHPARRNTLALGPWAEEPEVSAGGYGTADGELVSPGALALGEAVEGAAPPLFVSEGDRVSCFDADTLAFRFRLGRRGSAAGEFLSPAGLALGYNPLSPAGHGAELYVCDMNNHRVQVFAAEDGAFRRAFGRRGDAPGEFARPVAVAVARGRLLVGEFTGKRCQVLSLHGVPLQLLTTLAGGVPARLGGFAVDEDGGRVFALAAAPAAPLHVFRLRQL